MGDPTYPAVPVFSAIAFVLVLIPLPWHWQAWNSGTCLFMIWTAIGCLNQFINTIIWHDNVIDSAPYWCDFSTRITIAITVALPASLLCINRRLYKIAACQTVSISKASKRRDVIIDMCIGVGLPLLELPLHLVVNGHRYDILEGVGCYPATFNTWVSYPIFYVWPNVIGLISLVYSVLTLREFLKRRAQFSQFLSAGSPLSVNRYFRLMLLSMVELLIGNPINAYGLYLNTQNKIHPYTSWADVHFDWYIISTFPAVVWRANKTGVVMVELNRWILIFSGFLFFAFFGFAEEARKHYRKAFWAVAKRLGIRPSEKKMPSGLKASIKGPILPTFQPHTPQPHTPEPLKLKSDNTKSSDFSSSAGSSIGSPPPAYHPESLIIELPDTPSSTECGLTPATRASYILEPCTPTESGSSVATLRHSTDDPFASPSFGKHTHRRDDDSDKPPRL